MENSLQDVKSGLASPRVMATQETFVFLVVEVMPEDQTAAQGAMIVSLQESFPCFSVSDSVLLFTNCEIQERSQTLKKAHQYTKMMASPSSTSWHLKRVKFESAYKMFYSTPALISLLPGYGCHGTSCLMATTQDSSIESTMRVFASKL